jgi:hypothetical protein
MLNRGLVDGTANKGIGHDVDERRILRLGQLHIIQLQCLTRT